jgi:alpha-2-macroglobulin
MSLIKKIRGKKTYFFRSLLSGIFILIISIIIAFNIYNEVASIIIITTGIIIHVFNSIFYEKTGILYHRFLIKIPIFLKLLMEKIFDVKIISRSTFEKYGITEEIKEKTGSVENEKQKDLKPVVEKIKKDNGFFLFIRKIFSAVTLPFKSISSSIGKFFSLNKKSGKKAAITASVLFAVVILGIAAYSIIKVTLFSNIVSYSPTGVASNNSSIKVVYSSDIEFTDPNSPGKAFSITPRINGITKIEGRTLYFIPDNNLPNAEKYRVSINSSALKSGQKLSVEGKTFYFNTPMLEVTKTDFYYDIDEVNGKINSLIGEIEFNMPVNMDTLKERVEVNLSGKKLPFETELSERSNIVYLKIKDFTQGDTEQNIRISLKKGIMPFDGKTGMQSDYSQQILLKEKDRLIVEQCDVFPVVGTTYIAVKFNFPVNENDVKKNVIIDPAVDFSVKSEYRYSILEANFKPNMEYKVSISRQLKAKNGIDMKDDYTQSVTVKDIEPYAKFGTPGKILPLSDNLNIEFKTMNLDKVKVGIEKVYKNNLVNYLKTETNYDEENGEESEGGYGQYNDSRKMMFETTVDVEGGEVNQEVNNLINLKKLFNSRYRGLYYITLSDPKENNNYSRLFVHITDMGLIIKNDGKNLTAHVVNILTLDPIPGVKVSLVSRENQVLNESVTDAGGRIVINDYLKTQENLVPYIMIAEREDNFTYLTLNSNQLDFSTFDVGGNDYQSSALDAFAFTERGVYRPGEDVFATVITRNADLANPESVPLLCEVDDPTGGKVFERKLDVDSRGMTSITIPTSVNYKTGVYSLKFKQTENKIVGSADFKVEEFIPNTIESKVELVEKKGRTVRFKVKANELHGAPSKNLKVNCDVKFISHEFTDKNYPDYHFYNQNRNEFYQTDLNLGESTLDENGEKSYEVTVPDSFFPPSALSCEIYADVFDTSGRPVGALLTLPVDRYDTYFGLKISGEEPVSSNKKLSVRYVALSNEGKEKQEKGIQLRIERKIWYSIFKKYSWTEKYSSESYNELLFSRKIDIDKTGEYAFVPDKGGEYTVSIGNKDGMMSVYSFYVYDDDYTANRDLSDPYKLTMKSDKNYYLPGETAYITILSPFDGKCLVSYEREKCFDSMFVDFSKGKAVVPVKVTSDFVPNMYVTAVAFRKPDYKMQTLPPVSYGSINIGMDKKRMVQEVRITADEKIRSSDGLKVDLYLPGGGGSRAVIAVVDEGILQITNYRTPDPYDHFFRKRGLNVRTNTTLKDILPDIVPYKKAFGGDGDESERRHLNPVEARRVKSVSMYSGVIECDAEGKASFTFKIPDFNGKLRIMAVTSNNKKFGNSSAQVTVSDPIVLSPGIPRILAPGDESIIPLRVFNKTGKDGSISVALSVSGPLSVNGKSSYDIPIKNNQESRVLFKLKAENDAGVGKITFTASGNGETSKSETEIAVRPAATLDTAVNSGTVGGKEVNLNVPANYIRQGKYVRLAVSSDKMVRYISALDYLINYPYGCTEQITSQAFPMLYLKEYARYSGVFGENTFLIDKYIAETIKQIEERQNDNGSFSLWPGENADYPWVSDYASHFLIEARNNGYPVSDKVYDRILSRIGVTETQKGRLDRRDQNVLSRDAYHLYLKALIGKPDFDSMKYFYDKITDKKNKNNIEETDRCFIAASYALAGDKTKASEVLPVNFVIRTTVRKMTGNFDSHIRNTALYLYALSLMGGDEKTIAGLQDEFIKYLSSKGNFGSTQDTAWVLLAMNKSRKSVDAGIDIDVSVNGKLFKKITGQTVLTKELAGAKTIALKNNGGGIVYYDFVSYGTPLNPDPSGVESGLAVQKEFRNVDGTKIDIKGVKKSEQIVVTLTVKNRKNTPISNLVLVDMLPSGFEIENPRIESRGEFRNIPENDISLTYSDIRDDRIILFVKEMTGVVRYSYVVRAVSAGNFVMPQFYSEAMYDPEIFGRTKSLERLVVLDDDK